MILGSRRVDIVVELDEVTGMLPAANTDRFDSIGKASRRHQTSTNYPYKSSIIILLMPQWHKSPKTNKPENMMVQREEFPFLDGNFSYIQLGGLY